jgi:hypothetical protein
MLWIGRFRKRDPRPGRAGHRGDSRLHTATGSLVLRNVVFIGTGLLPQMLPVYWYCSGQFPGETTARHDVSGAPIASAGKRVTWLIVMPDATTSGG